MIAAAGRYLISAYQDTPRLASTVSVTMIVPRLAVLAIAVQFLVLCMKSCRRTERLRLPFPSAVSLTHRSGTALRMAISLGRMHTRV